MSPVNAQQLALRFHTGVPEHLVPPEPLARCQQLVSQLMIQIVSKEVRGAQEATDERKDSPEPS